jgi:serine/threonine-protein kinase
MAGVGGHLVAGRYCLIEPVGQGGMGRVWRSHDQLLDREVAVKEVLLPDGLSAEQREELTARAMREARAAARLHHPSIVAVHDAVQDGDVPWIVMEFVSGLSLDQTLTREQRLGWEKVAALGADVADALAHAHAVNVVHRDVKPANVLLVGRRTILTDFGIARLLDATMQLTSSGVFLGTPHYVPPEQLHGRPAEAAGDLWALGATLYTAVEGRPPYNGPTLPAVWTAILTQPPPPAPHAGPLAPVLSALLAKDPDQRPSALAVAEQLAALQHHAMPSVQHALAQPAASPGDGPAPLAPAIPAYDAAPTVTVLRPGATPTPPASDIPPQAPREQQNADAAPEPPAGRTRRAAEMRWKTRTGNRGDSSPAVSGGIVYIGGGRDVYALDAATGQVRWKAPAGGKGDSSPALSEGIVYIVSRDGHAYALDAATGQVRWKAPAGGKGGSSPAVSGGIVYIGGGRDVYALDAATGQVRWKAPAGGKGDSSPALSEGIVHIVSRDGHAYALDAATGQVRWKAPVGFSATSSSMGYSSPVVSEGLVYISGGRREFFGALYNYLHVLDAATGEARWKTQTGYLRRGDLTPTVSDGVVYIGGGEVKALDAATGEMRWQVRPGFDDYTSPTVYRGTVYVGSRDAHLYALDAVTGGMRWKTRTESEVRASPAVCDGIVYISSGSYMQAFEWTSARKAE